ncbi:hypothetical protein A2627_01920 [Candidatus Woesebacteria bacterium RIFCSPHIGHO2_01_FULL_39_28]|uniref:Polymerase beta nucleotidyltransferase domain-containing protein n=1 Tax=Candidatus Woesebacteria bacterium RIFCSPHIGHO2_01_FULL_39_28 TaxID=1802496 RepID=A0A1F7YJL3_9BACT|nr:MAG: hypothetical protein A2627_01920 [Candidatus Woesebacteria bacterium RIFCSPHIGHO2_01_FULL_39_28]OGM57031.1 MAG: hypothetical protein A3A50_03545 [Candidatus Woesebacteria bacterium RIFCSPLOWO2_01_FULL_38_20]
MSKYEKRLKQLVEILSEFKPEKIYTYGSWTKGSAKKDSDIDLALVVKTNSDTLELKREIAVKLFDEKYPYDLEPDIRVITKDVFNYRLSKGDPFVSNVAAGRLIYES